jgi:hypothetical protein
MDTDRPPSPDDVVDAPAAAKLLEVAVSRIDVLVSDGLLDPVPNRPGPVFRVADVLALRQVGG